MISSQAFHLFGDHQALRTKSLSTRRPSRVLSSQSGSYQEAVIGAIRRWDGCAGECYWILLPIRSEVGTQPLPKWLHTAAGSLFFNRTEQTLSYTDKNHQKPLLLLRCCGNATRYLRSGTRKTFFPLFLHYALFNTSLLKSHGSQCDEATSPTMTVRFPWYEATSCPKWWSRGGNEQVLDVTYWIDKIHNEASALCILNTIFNSTHYRRGDQTCRSSSGSTCRWSSVDEWTPRQLANPVQLEQPWAISEYHQKEAE